MLAEQRLIKMFNDNQINQLLSCPFCGEIPEYPNGDGTWYEIECKCGIAIVSIQISDLMTMDERLSDCFIDYRYRDEFIVRAKIEATKIWNTRGSHLEAKEIQSLIDEIQVSRLLDSILLKMDGVEFEEESGRYPEIYDALEEIIRDLETIRGAGHELRGWMSKEAADSILAALAKARGVDK